MKGGPAAHARAKPHEEVPGGGGGDVLRVLLTGDASLQHGHKLLAV